MTLDAARDWFSLVVGVGCCGCVSWADCLDEDAVLKSFSIVGECAVDDDQDAIERRTVGLRGSVKGGLAKA